MVACARCVPARVVQVDGVFRAGRDRDGGLGPRARFRPPRHGPEDGRLHHRGSPLLPCASARAARLRRNLRWMLLGGECCGRQGWACSSLPERPPPSVCLHGNLVAHHQTGNFLNTTAVIKGGNAVIMAQSMAATIITSGLLGIFYYGEGGGTGCKVVWFCSGELICVEIMDPATCATCACLGVTLGNHCFTCVHIQLEARVTARDCNGCTSRL
jgi:hypothetical protein